MFKSLSQGLVWALLFFLSYPFTSFAEDESITLTTYYPAPFGVFRILRLSPASISGSCEQGQIAYDSNKDQLWVCTTGTWEAPTGSDQQWVDGWVRGEDISTACLTPGWSGHNPNAPCGNVGIGTQTPNPDKGLAEYLTVKDVYFPAPPADSWCFFPPCSSPPWLPPPAARWASDGVDCYWEESSNNIYNTNSGNVGSSEAKLRVILKDSGGIRIRGYSDNPLFIVSQERYNHNTGIGTDSPMVGLDVVGKIRIADGTEGAGWVLTSDSNGLSGWSALVPGVSPASGGFYGWCRFNPSILPPSNVRRCDPSGTDPDDPKLPAICSGPPYRCGCAPGYTPIKIGDRGSGTSTLWSCYKN